MAKWKYHLIRFVAWTLMLLGISSIWEFTDVLMFGESQRSAVDAIAAIFMTDWINSKIWRCVDNGNKVD